MRVYSPRQGCRRRREATPWRSPSRLLLIGARRSRASKSGRRRRSVGGAAPTLNLIPQVTQVLGAALATSPAKGTVRNHARGRSYALRVSTRFDFRSVWSRHGIPEWFSSPAWLASQLGDPIEPHAVGTAHRRGRRFDRPILIGTAMTAAGQSAQRAGPRVVSGSSPPRRKADSKVLWSSGSEPSNGLEPPACAAGSHEWSQVGHGRTCKQAVEPIPVALDCCSAVKGGSLGRAARVRLLQKFDSPQKLANQLHALRRLLQLEQVRCLW